MTINKIYFENILQNYLLPGRKIERTSPKIGKTDTT